MQSVIIITIIHSYNYGAFLQAKATEIILSQLGFDPKFLNYTNKEEESQRKIFYHYKEASLRYNLRSMAAKLWHNYIHKGVLYGKDNFQKLIDELPKTDEYTTIDEIENSGNIEIFLCGSDQIWNPEIFHNKIDPVYFAGLRNVRKKISFASSFGSYKFNADEKDVIAGYLREFSSISVREEYGKRLVDSLDINKDVNLVLDPTLCINAESWTRLTSNCSRRITIDKDYLLLYFVNKRPRCQKLIDYIRTKLNLKVLWVKNDDLKRLNVDQIVNNATPYDLVELISKARFVLTDSFHGTAFAINLNIDFMSISHATNPERVKHLCKELGLMNRIIDENETSCTLERINYASVNGKLNRLREDSINWLKKALE